MEKAKKAKPTKFEKWFKFMRRVHRVFVYPIFPYKKHGHVERFNDGPYIIVCNHKSVLDVVPVVMTTDKPVHFMAKKELFEKGVGKWFTKKCECIPVSRDGTDVRAIMQAMKVLKEGGIVGIFPEGTRNKSDDMFLPFKSGAAALSIKTKCPIIPLVQVKKIKAFRRAHFYYGEPIEFTEFYGKKLTQEDIEKADAKLLDKMTELHGQLEELLKDKKRK